MGFVFVFAVISFQVVLVNLFHIVKVIKAFGIDAFMKHKVFAVFLGNQGFSTVRAAQFHGRKTAFIWLELGTAYLAEKFCPLEPLFL